MSTEIFSPEAGEIFDMDVVPVLEAHRASEPKEGLSFRNPEEFWTFVRRLKQLSEDDEIAEGTVKSFSFGRVKDAFRRYQRATSSFNAYTAALHSFADASDEEADERERHATENVRLREENERLKVQNELLRTRVAEQRRSLASEQRQPARLESELAACHQQQERFLENQDRMISLLGDRVRANDAIMCQLAAVENGRPRMFEQYFGQVQQVGESTVVVVYSVNGELVEQTYEHGQFKDKRPPKEGACVKVLVFVVEYEPDQNADSELTPSEPRHRKRLDGPDEF